MDLTIKALSPELLDDYLYFFNHVAFTDHQEWVNCYCIHFHWYPAMDDEFKQFEAAGGTDFTRNRAIRFIREGVIKGYLAYIDSTVVGWRNSNDKVNYSGLSMKNGRKYGMEMADALRRSSRSCAF